MSIVPENAKTPQDGNMPGKANNLNVPICPIVPIRKGAIRAEQTR
jgi:hypothetical protein